MKNNLVKLNLDKLDLVVKLLCEVEFDDWLIGLNDEESKEIVEVKERLNKLRKLIEIK